MTLSIRILVVDDHPVVRDGLVSMLGTQPDFAVVGQAASGLEAVEKSRALKPSLVLLDLEMPEMDGVEALRRIVSENPETQVVVFTAYDSDERIVGAVRAGAKGYLLKGAPRAELFNAIRVVSAGGSLLQPVIASKLLETLNRPDNGADSILSERERQVLALLVQGKSNKAIAAELIIAERTVKFHVSSIMTKLGAGNRTEVVALALQRGLVRPGERESG